MALAPPLLLSLVGLPLFAVPVSLVAFFVFQTLPITAIGASGDRYIVASLLPRPAGTLLYDSDVRHSSVFEPSGG